MAYKYSQLDYGYYRSNGKSSYKVMPWATKNATTADDMDKQKEDLMDQYQTAYDEAKAANETRYQDILSGYDTMYSDTEKAIAGYGETARRKMAENQAKADAKVSQSLINSGLHTSTIAPAAKLQSAKSYADEIAALEESIAMTKSDKLNSVKTQKLTTMENRTDTYPDTNMYLGLLEQLGNYGS